MTATTQTLAEWLLARIAEDEAVARAASPGPWHVNAESDEVLAVDEITVCDGFALSGPQTRATTAHIARHDPARVLAECEAKRRIVELHSDSAPFCDSHVDHGMTHREAYDAYPQQREWCDTLRALAAIYADRDGFREEWRDESVPAARAGHQER